MPIRLQIARALRRRPLVNPAKPSSGPTRLAPRRYTTPPTRPSEQASQASPTPPPPTALRRLITRLPRPLRPYAARLESAPLSHAAAFLILHEVTAIVPLLGLFGLFHYTDLHLAPVAWVSERYGGYVNDGLARFERYFRRKGWFGFGENDGPSEAGDGQQGADLARKMQAAQGPYRVVVEVALAYAITKALLPLRIAASLWATPWFAGVLVRAKTLIRRT